MKVEVSSLIYYLGSWSVMIKGLLYDYKGELSVVPSRSYVVLDKNLLEEV